MSTKYHIFEVDFPDRSLAVGRQEVRKSGRDLPKRGMDMRMQICFKLNEAAASSGLVKVQFCKSSFLKTAETPR